MTAQNLFDVVFFSHHWRGEDCSSRNMVLMLVSSCPEGLAQKKWEQS